MRAGTDGLEMPVLAWGLRPDVASFALVARPACTCAWPDAAPMSLLPICTEDPAALAAAQTLVQHWQQQGLVVLAPQPCSMLVREAVRLAPRAIVLLASPFEPEVSEALRLLAGTAPRPVLVVGAPHLAPSAAQAMLDMHLMAWLAPATDADTLGSAAVLAFAQFEQLQQIRASLAGAQARLDERKWVDRAKGVLMKAHQLSEDEAFTLLRTASMQANLRVGEVSRGLLEAAQWAEGINRAGQLRMLSQRQVKGLALRAVARGRIEDTLEDTARRVRDHLQWLQRQTLPPELTALADAVREAWQPLEAGTGHWPPREGLAAALELADRQAELLLSGADALTGALESASGRRHLQVINLSGRQRMLAQRLAKQALLADLLPAPQAQAHARAALQTVQAFEAALHTLEQAPLASEAIRAALSQARAQWQRLLAGLRRADGSDPASARAALARESEALVASFDHLTRQYEHSMQVLLG